MPPPAGVAEHFTGAGEDGLSAGHSGWEGVGEAAAVGVVVAAVLVEGSAGVAVSPVEVELREDGNMKCLASFARLNGASVPRIPSQRPYGRSPLLCCFSTIAHYSTITLTP